MIGYITHIRMVRIQDFLKIPEGKRLLERLLYR